MGLPTRAPRRTLILAGLAFAVVLAGLAIGVRYAVCNDDGPTTRAAAATSSPSSSPSTAAASAGPKPSSANPPATPAGEGALLKLGDKRRFTLDGFVVEVAALKIEHGEDYEGVQVRTCNRGADISVTRTPWVLGYDDFESLHTIDTVGGGLPAPAYEDRDLTKGQCAKGWVNFTSVPGERPDGIQYTPEGGEPIRWSFAD